MPSSSPDTGADAYLERARELLARGLVAEARQALQACLREHVGHRPALALMREIHRRASAMPPPASRGEWGPGRVLFDDVTLVRPLGEGGMGRVWLACSQNLGRSLAVKTILADRLALPDHQAMFFRELQTWIDLPEHPHLVACRFFRTLDGHVAIFADALDGGSLKERIEQGHLSTLPSILDVAIQVAWGLEAAHAAGVIHRDIKPANVLLTRGGQARVTDFGLAHAMPLGALASAGRDVMASARGMTPAYCSPEQAVGLPLDHRTDIWSWGLVVLEMFAGRLPCLLGADARRALDLLVASDDCRTRIPDDIAGILARCFAQDPDERWPSMGDLALRMREIFEQTAGHPHPRPWPPSLAVGPAAEPLNRSANGDSWEDPQVWAERVASAEGSTAPPAAPGAPARSRRAQAIADLARFDELVARLERQISADNPGRKELLARMLMQKGLAHSAGGDLSGYLGATSRSLSLWEELIQQGRADLKDSLAWGCAAAAEAHWQQGDGQTALGLLTRAISLRQELAREDPAQPAEYLARHLQGKGRILVGLGRWRDAVLELDKGRTILEQCLLDDDREALRLELAFLCSSEAVPLVFLEQYDEARELFSRSISIWEPLVTEQHREELVELLANACTGKAASLSEVGRRREALELLERATSLYERLVYERGRSDLADDLAVCCLNRSLLLGVLGEPRLARACVERSVAIRERLVLLEGRQELTPGLAMAYQIKGSTLTEQGDFREALPAYDQAIALWERLQRQAGAQAVFKDLAVTLENKAICLGKMEQKELSLRFHDQAIAVAEGMARSEQDELRDEIAMFRSHKASLLVDMGRPGEALPLFDQAIDTLASMLQQGRIDLREALARACCNRGLAWHDTGEHQAALDDCERSISLWEAMIQEGQREFLGDLADSRLTRALWRLRLDPPRATLDEAVAALADLEAEALLLGREHLRSSLEKARGELAPLLASRSNGSPA